MSEIILDIGSGRSLPDFPTSRLVIDSVLRARDKIKAPIILKAQLFKNIPPNVSLNEQVFLEMYYYCETRGIELTASVFDAPSLRFLLRQPVPFVKIAYRPDRWWLADMVPRGNLVYISGGEGKHPFTPNSKVLFCVAKYPANISDYDGYYTEIWDGISDHTVGLDLYRRHRPGIWEKHYCLDHTSSNPDAGPFAITPEELNGIEADNP